MATVITLCALAASATAARAQQTTGNITGRITDTQKAAVPGVTVTARNAETGFSRTDVSDSEGVYRLSALPVGTYALRAELQGFTTFERQALIVNVSQTLDLNFDLSLAGVQESVSVTMSAVAMDVIDPRSGTSRRCPTSKVVDCLWL